MARQHLTFVRMAHSRLSSKLPHCEITHVRRDVARDDAKLGPGQGESLESSPARLGIQERIRGRVRSVQHALDADLADARRDQSSSDSE